MDTLSLPNTNTWPDDRIIIPKITFQRVKDLFTGRNLRKIDVLTLDVNDQNAIINFAKNNGFTYTAKAKATIPFFKRPLWMGVYATSGLSPLVVHITNGVFQGSDITTCLHYIAIDERFSALDFRPEPFTILRRSIIEVSLPRSYGNVLYDSKVPDLSEISKEKLKWLSKRIRKTDSVEFDSYYNFISYDKAQAEQKELLSVDAKKILIESGGQFNVEFYKNKMYVLTQQPIYMAGAIGTVSKFLNEELAYLKTV